MGDLAESFGRCRAYALAGAIGGDKFGVAGFQLFKPRAQRVIGGVADGGRVLLVIGLIVAMDFSAQIGKFTRGFIESGEWEDGHGGLSNMHNTYLSPRRMTGSSHA
jgi:hypothetical protein